MGAISRAELISYSIRGVAKVERNEICLVVCVCVYFSHSGTSSGTKFFDALHYSRERAFDNASKGAQFILRDAKCDNRLS